MADNYIQRRAKAYAKRAQTAWEAYQSSGERRYDREYTEFSMIADALRKAADNEDHMQKYFNAEQRLDKAVAQDAAKPRAGLRTVYRNPAADDRSSAVLGVGMVIFDVEKECDEWQRCPHCWHNDDNGLWCFATCGRYDEKGER